MKKILCLFGALTLTVTSCSSNDDSGNTETAILPKTIKFSEPDYPLENTTSTITYDGNKVVSIIDEGSRTNFTYEGNVIVKMIEYDNTNGDKIEEESYSYTDGKLTSTLYAKNFTSKYPFGQYKGRYTYTYNQDGTVKKETYSINATTGVESKDDYLEVYTFQNGNLVKLVATDQPSGLSSVRTSIYEYDVKNSPFKNVLGYNLLIDADNSSANNLIKHTYTYSKDNSSYSRKTIYEYNADGYPTKETLYGEDGIIVSEIHEYTY